jgi:hypothetical protein
LTALVIAAVTTVAAFVAVLTTVGIVVGHGLDSNARVQSQPNAGNCYIKGCSCGAIRQFVRSGVMHVLCTKLLRGMKVHKWGDTDLFAMQL